MPTSVTKICTGPPIKVHNTEPLPKLFFAMGLFPTWNKSNGTYSKIQYCCSTKRYKEETAVHLMVNGWDTDLWCAIAANNQAFPASWSLPSTLAIISIKLVSAIFIRILLAMPIRPRYWTMWVQWKVSFKLENSICRIKVSYIHNYIDLDMTKTENTFFGKHTKHACMVRNPSQDGKTLDSTIYTDNTRKYGLKAKSCKANTERRTKQNTVHEVYNWAKNVTRE